ncbi:lipopolysaccharide biosynthesis protein [Micromonospora sp. U21]|uniref:lipopolysaccharide biosynthesis protein n=1 Tax=Micromonospora sp. U21 TaxID=2824899 RepID=UPI001B399E38|nr:lipopolysaccharide biosynthesis protein [Micromonospora sp. U21]MBQ0901396.1 lipopolysaccharide biosynthesis protein [Micromonospora sp. U21]
MAAAPLLSRIYRPADFGVLTVVAALTLTIGTVSVLRYDLAVPLPERERDAHTLVALGIAAACVTVLAGTVAVLAVRDEVARIFGQPELETWLWVVPPAAAATGVVLLLNQLAIRHRRYGSIGRRNFFQSATTAAMQLTLGGAALRPGGLVLGLGMGQAMAALVLMRGAGFSGGQARAGRERRHLREVARRYRGFPLLLTPSGLLNVLGTQLPVLLIAYWYGGSVAGWLGLTQRVIAIPAALVASAVAQVYLAEVSRAARQQPGRCRSIFVAASRKLALFAGLTAVVLWVAAPAAFSVVFGSEWERSGTYAQALALYVAAQLMASPLSQTLVVFEQQGRQLAWDVGRVVLVAGAVSAVAAAGASSLVAVWALSVSGLLAYTASWLMALRTVTFAGRQAEAVGVTETPLVPQG